MVIACRRIETNLWITREERRRQLVGVLKKDESQLQFSKRQRSPQYRWSKVSAFIVAKRGGKGEWERSLGASKTQPADRKPFKPCNSKSITQRSNHRHCTLTTTRGESRCTRAGLQSTYIREHKLFKFKQLSFQRSVRFLDFAPCHRCWSMKRFGATYRFNHPSRVSSE